MKTLLLLVTVFSLSLSCPTYGETESQVDFQRLTIKGKRLIEHGVDSWNLKTLMNARGMFEKILTVREQDYLSHYYLAYADYRICILYTSQEEKKTAYDYLEEGIEHLKRSIHLNPNFCDSHALLASLLGLKIGFKWYLGMTLGPEANSRFETSLQVDSLNPRTYLLLGISKYNTPKMFGGGMDKAETNLLKAIHLYQTQSAIDSLLPSWGHEEAYAWLGKVYMEKREYEKAKAQLEKALQVKPEYGWVKHKLQSQLNQKIKKEEEK